MTSLQLLKSSFCLRRKMNSLSAEFNSTGYGKRILRLSNTKTLDVNTTRLRVSCQLQESENQSNGEEPPESLFMKELRRRGMTPTSLLEEGNRSIDEDEDTKFKEEEGGILQRNAVSTDSERSLFNQREQSMALNSEALEGLIPRAKLLLKLGGTFFLGFWPLILITVAFFSALYLYFGPTFIHDGSETPMTPPQYIDDPYPMLEEERITQVAPPLN